MSACIRSIASEMISGSADLATSNGRQTCSRFQVSDTVSCKCTGRRYEPGWRCVAEKQCKVPKLGEFWSPQVFPSLIHFRRSIHSRDFPMSHPCRTMLWRFKATAVAGRKPSPRFVSLSLRLSLPFPLQLDEQTLPLDRFRRPQWRNFLRSGDNDMATATYRTRPAPV